jgi:hypothetical protein
MGEVTLPSSMPDYYSICTLIDDPSRELIQTAVDDSDVVDRSGVAGAAGDP